MSYTACFPVILVLPNAKSPRRVTWAVWSAAASNRRTHTARLLGPCWLHSTAAAGDHSMVLASPKCWDLLLHLGCTLTNSLSWALFVVPNLTFLHDPFSHEASTGTPAAPSPVASPGRSQCQASAALHDPFISSELVAFGRLLHTTQSDCQHRAQPWPPLEQGELLCAGSEETLPEDFTQARLPAASAFRPLVPGLSHPYPQALSVVFLQSPILLLTSSTDYARTPGRRLSEWAEFGRRQEQGFMGHARPNSSLIIDSPPPRSLNATTKPLCGSSLPQKLSWAVSGHQVSHTWHPLPKLGPLHLQLLGPYNSSPPFRGKGHVLNPQNPKGAEMEERQMDI
ncbi:hypothetical protein U0070_026586 [Myodes glareolus]|uniref:Uncharacterized protein n=1 Tax=Myodes glareolus TaxID=447135 RepID=A0AAW0JLK7_MYOGA